MYFDIKKAVCLGGYKIKLFFKDKKSGVVDFENYPHKYQPVKKRQLNYQ
jgi:hypothetical protein